MIQFSELGNALNNDFKLINKFLKDNVDKGEVITSFQLYESIKDSLSNPIAFSTFKVRFSSQFNAGKYPDFQSTVGPNGGYKRIRGRKTKR
jgi:hypothetical protein